MSCTILLTTVLVILSTVAFGVPVKPPPSGEGSCPYCSPLHLPANQNEVPAIFESQISKIACGSITPIDSYCNSQVSCYGTYDSNESYTYINAQQADWWAGSYSRGTAVNFHNFTCTSNGWIDPAYPNNPIQSPLIVCLANLAPGATEHICPSTTDTPVVHCPQGWTYFDPTKSCYKTLNNCTFDDCEMQCQLYGSHLTSIHSDAENTFVNDFASSGIPQWSFNQTTIGMHMIEGKWVWTDGTPFDFTNWAMGKPDYQDKQWCGLTYADAPSKNQWNLAQYKWDDVECNVRTRAAVCKKPALLYTMRLWL